MTLRYVQIGGNERTRMGCWLLIFVVRKVPSDSNEIPDDANEFNARRFDVVQRKNTIEN